VVPVMLKPNPFVRKSKLGSLDSIGGNNFLARGNVLIFID
jgi:hypothetical protein